MKYLSIVFVLILSLVGFGQDSDPVLKTRTDTEAQQLPPNFTYKKQDSGILQLTPDENAFLSDAELGKAYQALGIIAQPEQDNFGLLFINGQNEYQFEKQFESPFLIILGERKITGLNLKVIKKDKIKKLKVEILSVEISRDDFEQILLANNILITYGNIKYDVAPANLQAFRYVDSQISGDNLDRNDSDTRTTLPTNTGGDVRVKGYYRKDGTYVRPHTRKSPKRKN